MFFILFAAWIIFNGRITAEILIFGAVISAAVCVFMSVLTEYSFKKELKLLKKLPYILLYILVLVVEIIKANLVTAVFIIKGNRKIDPVIVCFDSPLKTEYAASVLANSITLTPGTISVSMADGKFRVHCLDRSLCEGIDSSVFVKVLRKIEQ